MNRTQGNMYHMHGDAWVRHIRKMLHDPEKIQVSNCPERLANDARAPRGSSRWERHFQD